MTVKKQAPQKVRFPRKFASIRSLVFDLLKKDISTLFDDVSKEVLFHFPTSRFRNSHFILYKAYFKAECSQKGVA